MYEVVVTSAIQLDRFVGSESVDHLGSVMLRAGCNGARYRAKRVQSAEKISCYRVARLEVLRGHEMGINERVPRAML